jgi:hypothetical protein
METHTGMVHKQTTASTGWGAASRKQVASYTLPSFSWTAD